MGLGYGVQASPFDALHLGGRGSKTGNKKVLAWCLDLGYNVTRRMERHGEEAMAMNFKTFGQIVGAVVDARHPVMIRGRHGVGKSETVYAFAKSRNMRVVERRASQMTEGDLVGLPVVDGNHTAWNPPDWFKDACENGVVLFLDEVDRAVQEVRQGFFQLTDSRTINGHRLHPDTIIFAAVNGGVHGAQYAVQDMDPAELDRWTVFDLEPTVEDWLDFATKDGRIHPMITDFIRDNNVQLEHKGEFEPNKKYPSRRSWVRFNDTIAPILSDKDWKKQTSTVYNIGTGFIGFEGAVAFKDYLDKYEKQLSVNDILVEGKHEKTKGFKLNDHIALSDKILASGRIKKDMPKAEMENLARYFFLLPSEAAMKFYTNATKGDENIQFLLEFHKLTVDGKGVKSFIQDLLASNGKKKKA